MRKTHSKNIQSILAITSLAASSAFGVNLTDLSAGTAQYDGGAINTGNASHPTVPTPIPVQNLALGHTMNVAFTPTVADLSGTVLLMELGGSANGSGLYLYNGELFYTTKQASSDNFIADSLNDTILIPGGGVTHGEAALLSTYGLLTAGLSYTAAVSWDQAGNLQLAIQQGVSAGVLDTFTLTGSFGNWQGDRSFSVGQSPRTQAGGVGGSVGGMAGENVGFNPAAPWNVETDTDVQILQSLAGTVENALYWNAAGNLTVVPEPSVIAVAGVGLTVLLLARRRR